MDSGSSKTMSDPGVIGEPDDNDASQLAKVMVESISVSASVRDIADMCQTNQGEDSQIVKVYVCSGVLVSMLQADYLRTVVSGMV